MVLKEANDQLLSDMVLKEANLIWLLSRPLWSALISFDGLERSQSPISKQNKW